MPNADLQHIPEPGTFLLSGSASSSSSPSAGSPAGLLSSPQDSNPVPARFPVGFPHISEEHELLRGWTMVSVNLRGETQPSTLENGQAGWVPAASVRRHQQCPLLAWHPWQRTGLKSIPSLVVYRKSLMHPPGKGNPSLKWKLNLEPVLQDRSCKSSTEQFWWQCFVGTELSNCQILDCQIPTEFLYFSEFS